MSEQREQTMPERKKYKSRRTKLWREDPHCRNCGVLTILPEMRRKDLIRNNVNLTNMATLEHLNSRLNPERLKPNYSSEIRTTLLCYKCNENKGKEDCNVNFREIHKERSHKL